MKKGFTLLELIIVIIIIGILATLGLTQYGKMVERGRGAEARQLCGNLRSLAAAHYLEYNTLIAPNPFSDNIAGVGTADDKIPSVCRSSHYFSYSIAGTTATKLKTTATRCAGTGRGGNSPAAGRTLILTTTYPAGTDVWSGNGGY